jgi:hypothetical protein
MKLEWILVFSRYNKSFRQARKLLDRSLRPATLALYRPMPETNAYNLLAQVSGCQQTRMSLRLILLVRKIPMMPPISLNSVPTVQPVRIFDLGHGVWL